MIMTPSKTALRQDHPKIRVAPDWVAVVQKEGVDASGGRDASVKSRAWWDIVANVIVGRR